MPDLNDVFTTKRGIGSSGPEMEKEEEKFCPTKHLFCIHTIESTDIIKIERFQTVLQCRNTMLQWVPAGDWYQFQYASCGSDDVYAWLSVSCLADCHRLEMFVCRSGSSLVIGVEPGVLFSPGINLVWSLELYLLKIHVTYIICTVCYHKLSTWSKAPRAKTKFIFGPSLFVPCIPRPSCSLYNHLCF